MLDKKKIDLDKVKSIDEWLRKNNSYGYYAEPSSLSRLKPKYHPGINCSDIDIVDEKCKEYEKEYFQKHILREATPGELEWIKKQPRVDLDSPEHEHLKPILRKMISEGWFD